MAPPHLTEKNCCASKLMVDYARSVTSAFKPRRRVSPDQALQDECKEKVDDGRGNTIAHGLGRRRSERIGSVDASGLRRTPPPGAGIHAERAQPTQSPTNRA